MTAYQRPRSGDPAGVDPPPTVPVTVDGHPVTAHAGQTVAAVLLANGRDTWRTTRVNERPRGTFCGIGACYDCLVTVNGLPDTRACQRTVEANDAITTQQGAVLPTTTEAPHEEAAPVRSADGVLVGDAPAVAARTADVVVVGGGPAGIAAAIAAAEAGAEVLLVDNGRAVGGQFNRQLPVEFAARRPDRLQHGWKSFAAQRDRIVASSRITHLTETAVWAVEGRPTAAAAQVLGRQGAAGHQLWAQRGPADAAGRTPFPIDAKAVVLATGAYDRVLPFPGWDLPGVYTAGAAQALAKGQRISVGRRVLVAGTGPFLLPVAESLVGVGAEVVALLEANSLGTVRKGWSSDPTVATGKLREAVGYGAVLARHRLLLRHGWTVVAAHGTDHVEAVTVSRLDEIWRLVPGTERRIEVDAVCLGFGFTANLELAVAGGCELTTAPDGGPAVTVDADQQTTTPGIFAAGELTGVAGAVPSTAEGEVAGAAAAQYALGAVPNTDARARSAVLKGQRLAAALARAYPVRDGWKTWSTAETLVCRCEEVTRGELEDAAADRGLDDGRAMKLSSRAGLGMCQGRVCSRNVADLLAEPGAVPKPSMKRPIAVPVRLRDLARAQEEQP